MQKKPYRKNVGMVIFNRNGEVLVGERLNVSGAWQFPQGGIDEGEEPFKAAQRELYEEVGIADAPLVYEHPEWLYYDFPPDLEVWGKSKKYSGQMQRWYLFYWDQPADRCNLDTHQREFNSVRFIPLERCADSIVEFKKQVYLELIKSFTPAIADYIKKLSEQSPS
ncbi:RNA pyrophosphohydrolase [Tumidithrix elongata RA019]|uniref:RNA pyrophosphohydrolase n=1 Tax=Tumidithrix elongata BACA0141 TaxID=2716417 RepID=A0AAW9Q320_9CYAN|nr:RNA pyrophosphohydrolase [Tumidithrix elongata RA019]